MRPTSVMGCTKRVAEQIEAGEPVKIMDLAHDLIRLSGLEEGVDVDITYSGVRLGEKLYEEVFFGWDALRIQLRALVPDFHVPPPPPPTEDSKQRPATISGERKLHLA